MDSRWGVSSHGIFGKPTKEPLLTQPVRATSTLDEEELEDAPKTSTSEIPLFIFTSTLGQIDTHHTLP